MSSRELKENEKLDSKAIAKDGIAVIVALGNPLEDISMESVKESNRNHQVQKNCLERNENISR